MAEFAKVDLNTATLEEMAAVPSIGRDLAKKVYAFRNQFGPLERWENLKEVPGIDDRKLAAIQQDATLGSEAGEPEAMSWGRPGDAHGPAVS